MLFSVLFSINFLFVYCDYQREWTTDEILSPNYNKERPPIERYNEPVQVDVAISVLSFLPNSEKEMSFDVDIFLHLYWRDYRLKSPRGFNSTNKITLSNRWKDHLWTPDIYFRNAIRGGISNIIGSPSSYFSINNQNIFMASRIQMTIRCDMDFKKYPFDEQECEIKITTLTENSNVLQLNWRSFNVVRHLILPQYRIDKIKKEDGVKQYDIGSYSCLVAKMYLTRNVSSFLVKRYIPSFLIVIMTFIGFWLPTSVYPARVSLAITALLALITQQIQSELNVSYVYALEVWTIMCIAFVFGTLIEYAFAIAWNGDDPSERSQGQQNTIIGNNIGMKKWINIVKVKPTPRNNSIDMIARILFPATFLGCVIAYFVNYLV